MLLVKRLGILIISIYLRAEMLSEILVLSGNRMLSPLAMIILQYVAACFLCGLFLLAISRLNPISPRGWFEYYRFFTIPYIIMRQNDYSGWDKKCIYI